MILADFSRKGFFFFLKLKYLTAFSQKLKDARKDRGEAEKQPWDPASRNSEKVLTRFHYEDQSVPTMNLVSLHLRLKSTACPSLGRNHG